MTATEPGRQVQGGLHNAVSSGSHPKAPWLAEGAFARQVQMPHRPASTARISRSVPAPRQESEDDEFRRSDRDRLRLRLRPVPDAAYLFVFSEALLSSITF